VLVSKRLANCAAGCGAAAGIHWCGEEQYRSDQQGNDQQGDEQTLVGDKEQAEVCE